MLLEKKPISDKQREAARAARNDELARPYPRNGRSKSRPTGRGAKSRGPITPQGKLNSANARLRTGPLARTILLEGESAEHFAQLLESLTNELNPETDIEISLVESLAIARWRQRRIQSIERAALITEAAKQTHVVGPAEKTTQAMRGLALESSWLDRLRLHESRYARQVHPHPSGITATTGPPASPPPKTQICVMNPPSA